MSVIFLVIYFVVKKPITKIFYDYMIQYTLWLMDRPVLGVVLFILLFALGQQVFVPPNYIVIFASFCYTKIYGLALGLIIITVINIVGQYMAMNITYFTVKSCGIGKCCVKRWKYFKVFNYLMKT